MHARAYAGAATTARNIANLNEGSQIRESHRSAEKDARVQDAYSLRCTPQVHGAVRDSLAQAREMAAVELTARRIIRWYLCATRTTATSSAAEIFTGSR